MIGDDLFRLVDELGRRKVLLNFGNVEFMSSAALGKLITLHRKLQAVQGKLVLCKIAKDILDVFKITKLDKLLTIARTSRPGSSRSDRRAAAADGPAAFHPDRANPSSAESTIRRSDDPQRPGRGPPRPGPDRGGPAGRPYTEHDIFAIKLAVEEALVNAIKHGNQMDPDKTVASATRSRPSGSTSASPTRARGSTRRTCPTRPIR